MKNWFVYTVLAALLLLMFLSWVQPHPQVTRAPDRPMPVYAEPKDTLLRFVRYKPIPVSDSTLGYMFADTFCTSIALVRMYWYEADSKHYLPYTYYYWPDWTENAIPIK